MADDGLNGRGQSGAAAGGDDQRVGPPSRRYQEGGTHGTVTDGAQGQRAVDGPGRLEGPARQAIELVDQVPRHWRGYGDGYGDPMGARVVESSHVGQHEPEPEGQDPHHQGNGPRGQSVAQVLAEGFFQTCELRFYPAPGPVKVVATAHRCLLLSSGFPTVRYVTISDAFTYLIQCCI